MKMKLVNNIKDGNKNINNNKKLIEIIMAKSTKNM